MKKIYIIFLLALSVNSSQSQVLISLLLGDKLNSDGLEFGIEGGVNNSFINGLETNKLLSTFNLGFYFDIRMKNQWFLYTGVLVKADMGANDLTTNDLKTLNIDTYEEVGNHKQIINYFIVPALAKYKFKNRFYLEAGPQFGLMHKPYVQYDATYDGIDAQIKEYNEDNINRIDAGMLGGCGYQFLKGWEMSIGLKYYYGLVDVYKNIPGSNNNSLFLKVNIPIGAGKQDKELVQE